MSYFDMKWRLCACRANAGYSQVEVAEKMGLNVKTIQNWENGITAPSIERAKELSAIYGIPLAYMDFTKEGNTVPFKDRMAGVKEEIDIF